MAAHAYWRFNFSASNGSGVTTVAELEMHTSIGGSTVTTGGTAIGTNINGTYPASQAFDGNTSTLCVSSAQPNTVGYHFASAVDIIEYAVIARSDGFLSDCPKSWTFEYSDDGSTWTQIGQSISNQTSWTLGQKRTFGVNDVSIALTGVALTGMITSFPRGAIGAQFKGFQPAVEGTPPAPNQIQLGKAPPTAATKVSGTVTVLGVATGGLLVRAYAKVTGELLGQATTAGDGTYSISCGGYFKDVAVIAYDPTTYQALVYDQVVPG